MSILTGKEIYNSNMISGLSEELINAASVDITLGSTILVETKPTFKVGIYLMYAEREPIKFTKFTFTEENPVFWLAPNQFILANSAELFFMDDSHSARYSSKSSMGRMGLEHMNSGWIDAGFHNSTLTLELKNMTEHQTIGLKAGDRIGQIVVYKHSPVDPRYSYRSKGNYNNALTTTPARFKA